MFCLMPSNAEADQFVMKAAAPGVGSMNKPPASPATINRHIVCKSGRQLRSRGCSHGIGHCVRAYAFVDLIQPAPALLRKTANKSQAPVFVT